MTRMAREKRLVLILSSLMVFGSAYCYDNPSALKSQLQQRFHDLPKSRYEFLFSLSYSLYSIPNVALPFFGGMLVDKFGVRSMALVLASLLLAGQLVFAFGCSIKNFDIMLIGRVLFGLGGETMWVAQSTFVTLWFESSELAFAFGVNTLFARMGTVVNDKLSPIIANEYSVTTALWVGAGFCVFSLGCTCILVLIDRRYDLHTDATHKETEVSSGVSLRDVFRFSRSFWLIAFKYTVFYACIGPFNNVASSILLERDFFKQPPPLCQRCGVGAYTKYCDAIAPECPPVPPFAWPLPKLSSNCTITNALDQLRCSRSPPYIQDEAINCDDLAWRDGPITAQYCYKKSYATELATTAMSITPLMIGFTAPISGTFVDMVGLRPLLAMVAETVIVLAHCALTWTDIDVRLVLTCIGLGACFFSSTMWPCIPYVVETRFVGTAFGAITAFSNCGLASVPLLVAAVYNASGKYIPHVEYVFITCAAITWLLGGVLNGVDICRGHVLNRRVLRPILDTTASSDMRERLLDEDDEKDGNHHRLDGKIV
ncbi:hypothetical protein AeMF1_002756 [Aphanomyces euteiches]|nr:hypothetical protein AeMF1_002756 [Aphanomyces euteiches]KAH9188363.1 hypothetical protein AeNC1_009658 [Aphanomyces euteiches]